MGCMAVGRCKDDEWTSRKECSSTTACDAICFVLDESYTRLQILSDAILTVVDDSVSSLPGVESVSHNLV